MDVAHFRPKTKFKLGGIELEIQFKATECYEYDRLIGQEYGAQGAGLPSILLAHELTESVQEQIRAAQDGRMSLVAVGSYLRMDRLVLLLIAGLSRHPEYQGRDTQYLKGRILQLLESEQERTKEPLSVVLSQVASVVCSCFLAGNLGLSAVDAFHRAQQNDEPTKGKTSAPISAA